MASELALAYDAARAAWPELEVDLAAFERRVESAIAAGAGAASVHGPDLYLAIACERGDARAISAFEARYAGDLGRALGRMKVDAAAAEEIVQSIRERLFVSQGGAPPKIATYSGRGPLGAWARALVVHAAVSGMRSQKRAPQASDSVLTETAAVGDPELAQIRDRYAASFKEAFRDALAALETRDRNVLRLVYVDGLTAEQVGLAYGVHRVSVARWLSQARESLFERTRALLGERLSLDAAEFASVTRLCLSQIDVSLDRLLVRDGSD